MDTRQSPFRGWIANLSDGSTVWETSPVPNEKTAWQKLIDRLHSENLKITALRLQRGGTTIHAMPPKACEGYFQAYEVRKKLFREEISKVQGIGSLVNGLVFISWMDEGGNVWQEIRPLEGSKIHTTVRD